MNIPCKNRMCLLNHGGKRCVLNGTQLDAFGRCSLQVAILLPMESVDAIRDIYLHTLEKIAPHVPPLEKESLPAKRYQHQKKASPPTPEKTDKKEESTEKTSP